MKIYQLSTGNLLKTIPIPTLSDPTVQVSTNALSVYKDLMFIAHGEAGVYVAQNNAPLTNNISDFSNLTVVGKLRLGDGISANHIQYRKDHLMVASGTGGVKILKVENTSDEGSDDDDEDDD